MLISWLGDLQITQACNLEVGNLLQYFRFSCRYVNFWGCFVRKWLQLVIASLSRDPCRMFDEHMFLHIQKSSLCILNKPRSESAAYLATETQLSVRWGVLFL